MPRCAKVASCRGAERAKVAARFLGDFFHYHRDLRRLEILNAALDSVNLVSNERMQELSRVNGTLYEFLLPEEQGETDPNACCVMWCSKPTCAIRRA